MMPYTTKILIIGFDTWRTHRTGPGPQISYVRWKGRYNGMTVQWRWSGRRSKSGWARSFFSMKLGDLNIFHHRGWDENQFFLRLTMWRCLGTSALSFARRNFPISSVLGIVGPISPVARHCRQHYQSEAVVHFFQGELPYQIID